MHQKVIDTALTMNAVGINQGTSGNVSARYDKGMLITPSGMAYDSLRPKHIVYVDQDARYEGDIKPSSEWRFHHDIYAARPDINAIIHTHSRFATTLACMGKDIPPFHYMIAVAGGKTIRCAPYATFGTQKLSDHALTALKNRKACLLANHGMIVCGENLDKAFAIAQEVELLCEMYLMCLQTGGANILSNREMKIILEKFKTYGKQSGKERKSGHPKDPWSKEFKGYRK